MRNPTPAIAVISSSGRGGPHGAAARLRGAGTADHHGEAAVMWAAPGSLAMHLHPSQFLGFAGVALGFVGYMPQVVHLLRQRCSAGLSVHAYLIWLTAAVLLLTHALLIYDGVFITLQTLGSVLDIAVLFLAIKYRGTACPDH
ncbi:MAG: PQ-loop repeat-containing protein [Chloroflexi bacterium]|nr:MAG: PQ-loop repeat-containing protein [Chloroflexota bacterium]